MSTHRNLFFGALSDPREVELIRSLAEKTRQGKIPWVKQANALTATIPNGFQINFVLAPMLIALPSTWQLLTVRDGSGSELVRVSNNANVLSILAGAPLSPENPVVAAANELFTLVSGAAGDNLDRAINTIKNL